MQDPKIRAGVIDALLEYLETDTIWLVIFSFTMRLKLMYSYPEEKPESLVNMQKQYWDPLFKLMKETYGAELSMAEGFSPARQSEKTVKVLRGLVEDMDHFELAGKFISRINGAILII